MNWQWTSIDSLSLLSKNEFDTLQPSENTTSPFLSYAFLLALEESKSVGKDTGWQANHLVVRDKDQTLIAFLPAYIKSHSYGEYIFDHSWAQAYQQHGLLYYPKLSVCVPFTPVTGPRILLQSADLIEPLISYIANIKDDYLAEHHLSSLHILFSQERVSKQFLTEGFHQRLSVQFNWYNNGFVDFDGYLEAMTARRRRSIRKERKGIVKQATSIKRIVAHNISEHDMAFFYLCYQQTYLKRSGHHGYLSEAFFKQILRSMPEKLLLIIAEQTNDEGLKTPIAGALFFFDGNGLYGRYWGALKEVSGLHFEVCYYQGIEFCIEQNIPMFNPGTQGEHKILRGFEPTLCYSNHSMQEPAFDDAVADFVNREAPHIEDYKAQSAQLLPFKQGQEDSE
ncbi:GNAT family N-acetyltransferase [Glaciecola sp. 2405UD65-10]|uniref:GNAT family N-acetyltransferase n=1 Tax=Glaciecola sp. 2405UD65-10 TaxID=3397244 RepID=UPI003B5C8119